MAKLNISLKAYFIIISFAAALMYITGLHVILPSKERFVSYYQTNLLTKSFNSNPVSCCSSSPCWDSLDNVNKLTGAQILQYFLWNNRSSCQLAYDFGGFLITNPSGIEGQKAVCIDPKVAPLPGDCIIYSFGIHDDWSFDEQMGRYGCQVYSFDPSINMTQHDHTPSVHFYDWGLGRLDENRTYKDTIWKMRTLSTIYETLTHLHGRVIIDYLKIDIEFAEWQVLPQIIESGMLSKVRQLGVEFHLSSDETTEKYYEHANLLRTLEKEGMVRFDSKHNPWYIGEFRELKLWGSLGYEIAWYNSKLEHPVRNVKPEYRDFLQSFRHN